MFVMNNHVTGKYAPAVWDSLVHSRTQHVLLGNNAHNH